MNPDLLGLIKNMKTNYEKILDTIPIDTGGLIRVGILDLTRGYGSRDIVRFLNDLEVSEGLSTDTRDLMNVAVSWDKTKPLEIESGTLFRILWFYFTKNKINRSLVPVRTLVNRVAEMDLNPEMVAWPLADLATTKDKTTQWQTAAILLGNKETLKEIPFYVGKTYNTKDDWEEQRAKGECWTVPRDPTLITQSKDYIHYLKTRRIKTKPDKLGDCDLYCFLRAFEAITREWAEENWPQLAKHESSRFQHTDEMLRDLREGRVITSKDHRVVEALAMLLQAKSIQGNYFLPIEKIKQRFSYPDCVAKKWPKFWEAMSYFPEAAKEAH